MESKQLFSAENLSDYLEESVFGMGEIQCPPKQSQKGSISALETISNLIYQIIVCDGLQGSQNVQQCSDIFSYLQLKKKINFSDDLKDLQLLITARRR